MNTRVLVDAIVRQTTVLIAQLATSGGLRAPLAHVANEVFLDLARELDEQGVSRKVSADMFGMALRAYLGKIRRLSESATDQGRSLWQAVYEFLRSHKVSTRDAVIQRFSRDDETLLRGILHDLSESGLVFSTGSGGRTLYRVATDDELGELRSERTADLDDLLWAIVFNEGPVDSGTLGRIGRIDLRTLDASLERLVASNRVEVVTGDGKITYRAHTLLVPVGGPSGWEAAVFDHFHALVMTVCTKLQLEPRTTEDDLVGGSTYGFVVWEGHPMQQEVLGLLQGFRANFQALRARVAAYNAEHESPAHKQRVLFYGGQCVTDEEREP